MKRRQLTIWLVIICWLAVVFVNVGCTPARDSESSLDSIVKPYIFSIAQWELETMPREVSKWISGGRGEVDKNEVDTVTQYFSLTERIRALKSQLEMVDSGNLRGDSVSLQAELTRLQQRRAELKTTVEKIIGHQIRRTLAQQGIYNPVINLRVNLPPLNFRLDAPPHVLVVSPRDRIESMREITLRQDIDLEEMEDIEARIDSLGVSSLVVELGGFGGTFPTFVGDNASLKFTIDTAIEEWLHQYLVFKPLGFLYLLDLTGVSRNYEIVTMNETVASMVSKEIGSMVYARYYQENGAGQGEKKDEESAFNREMRQIRGAVDDYLTQGKIEQAEEFMKEKRQYLAAEGYYIRKLNQAYFAFYGSYADSPTSVSPIGLEMRQLRAQSASVKDFLDRAAGMTSRADLRQSVK